jgi:hypothetical protein
MVSSLVPERIRGIAEESNLDKARMIERLSEAEKANIELKVQISDLKKNLDMEKNPFGKN